MKKLILCGFAAMIIAAGCRTGTGVWSIWAKRKALQTPPSQAKG